MATFGIASYIQNKLKVHVIENGLCVLLCDKSLNKKTQEKQSYFHLHFWKNGITLLHFRLSGPRNS